MSPRLLDRLAAARRRAFVGRGAELAAFRSALRPDQPGAVLFVHGPGGVGKSTLLRQFAWLAEDAGRRALWLDGRELHAGPEPAVAAVAAALGLPGDAGPDPLTALGAVGSAVLLVDNLEAVAPMDGWLREELLPRLPADAVVVLAGREPPSVAFRADPGWRSLLCPIRLGNLDREHGAELLRLRGVPDALHAPALAFTHGHPLALALLADVCAQTDGLPPATATPEVLAVLLQSLVGTVPSPAHLAALEASAQVLVTTEPLLAALLDVPAARELFEWLRDLSIMDYAPRGLFPHDFVRETLATELRWRHPQAHAAIRTRARAFYRRQFAEGGPAEQRAVLSEFAFLHRDNPVVGPFLRHVNPGTGGGRLLMARVGADEWPQLAEVIGRHEGAESAALAQRWFTSQPAAVSAVRDTDGALAGLVVAPMLGAATADDRAADPAAAAAWRHLADRGHTGDGALLVRHWMSATDHQTISEVQTFITLHLIRVYLTTPGLAQVFVTCADPELWAAAFEYTDFHRLPGADFEVGGRRYAMFWHDWRAVPPMAWITRMADRASGGEEPAPHSPTGPGQPPHLTEDRFAAAVRAALRDLTRLDRLQHSPLVASALVASTGAATPAEQARAVRDAIRAAADELQSAPRDRRLHRVLHHTFLQPAETQARAAELLDLPTSTYRRHLAAGIARLVEVLWQRELEARN